MKEYIVITGDSIEVLINDVNMMIRDGWKPQGGVAILQDVNEKRLPRVKIEYHQAMTR